MNPIERNEVNLSEATCLKILEELQIDSCHEYGEPGYSTDKSTIAFGNWNDYNMLARCHVRPKGRSSLRRVLNAMSAHIEQEWVDEWIVDYEADKAYRTQPDCYSWKPSYAITDDGNPLTPGSDFHDWLDYAIETVRDGRLIAVNSNQCPSFFTRLEDEGFMLWPGDGLNQTGLHAHMTADPSSMVKDARETHPDADVVIEWVEASQFYAEWRLWVGIAKVAVSSNRFSVDIQAKDAMNWLGIHRPGIYAKVRSHFPEDMIFDGLSYLDTEAMNVDEEWSSWLIEAIEETGVIIWEEGEPFAYITKGSE